MKAPAIISFMKYSYTFNKAVRAMLIYIGPLCCSVVPPGAVMGMVGDAKGDSTGGC